MSKKAKGIIFISTIYVIAVILSIPIFKLFESILPLYWNIFVTDVILTILMWIVGMIVHTASMYDPYWSVQPIIIYVMMMVHLSVFSFQLVIVGIVLCFWSFRLTINFFIGFHDLSYQDWRYTQLKEQTGKIYPLVNLLGIHLFPTVVVFLATIPLVEFMMIEEISSLYLVGIAVMILGILLELIADTEMKQFIKTRKDRNQVINIGLWKYSRHPNYLGEISFWWGTYFTLFLSYPSKWIFGIGALINMLMFLFISIPMEEKQLSSYKEAYDEYKKTTSVLLLLPSKKDHR